MSVNIEVKCRYCGQSEPVRKHRRGKIGFPRYFCRNCQRTFQSDYRYNGHKPEAKDKMIAMAMNGSRVSDTMKKRVVAHVFGLRTDETYRALLSLLEPFNIRFTATYHWKSYT